MKYYDGKKIKEYIRTHSDGLAAVEIGMDEDWSWTASGGKNCPKRWGRNQTATGGTEAMSDKPTYMDCWHFVAPLIPVDTDYTIDIYIMVFGALKEAEKKRIAEKKKGRKATQ